MLEPQDRRLLLESLRPPDGYAIDHAVGTTFSLDLLALLTAPLAFTLFDYQTQDGRPVPDPLALLQAVRRFADRITIFCQAGQIAIPRRHERLFGYLEGSVVEATARSPQGRFHPKLWVLRYEAAGQPVRYRVLCLSRNLTFDQSWDTALVLDGELEDRKNAHAANHPLGDFVAGLPHLARSVANPVRQKIDQMQSELRRVKFEMPEGFTEYRFWPLGIAEKATKPFPDRIDRLLVVSPFLSEAFLTEVAQQAGDAQLISRVESLQQISPECLKAFDPVYALSPAADMEEGQGGEDPAQDPTGGSVPPTADFPLTGLHAKLFLIEYGWDASVFTGSANATDAAFTQNVEFLVELMGKKSRCGIDAFLSQAAGQSSFRDLLQSFAPSETAVPGDPEQERLEGLVDLARGDLATVGFILHVTTQPENTTYRLQLALAERVIIGLPPSVTVACWPVSLAATFARPLYSSGGELAEFGPVSFTAITSFLAFEVTATSEKGKASSRFVLNLPLVGAPADRRDGILRELLGNREQVLRFLLFLLAEAGVDGSRILPLANGDLRPTDSQRSHAGNTALLETLIRAFDRHPEQLEQVARLVDDLRRASTDQDLLPEDFDAIWQPIWTAYQRRKQ